MFKNTNDHKNADHKKAYFLKAHKFKIQPMIIHTSSVKHANQKLKRERARRRLIYVKRCAYSKL